MRLKTWVFAGVVAVASAGVAWATSFGNGRSGGLGQTQGGTSVGSVPATGLTATGSTTNSSDTCIGKTYEKWVDDNHDGVMQSSEWHAVGKESLSGTQTAPSTSAPFSNDGLQQFAWSGSEPIPCPVPPGTVIRVRIRFGSWTDSNHDGKVDPGEVTWASDNHEPPSGVGVLPPTR